MNKHIRTVIVAPIDNLMIIPIGTIDTGVEPAHLLLILKILAGTDSTTTGA
jgi:hypothetical protein